MAKRYAMLVDYEYCIGCSECETACLDAHDRSVDKMGIKVQKLGPWRSPKGGWQYDFVPIPTDWCDLCESVLTEESAPACLTRCTYSVIKFGTLEQVSEFTEIKSKQIIVVR